MAAHGGTPPRPVKDLLFAEGCRFDFYQAVRLLEVLGRDRVPVAEGSDPALEPVRFRSRVGLDFPASAVHSLDEDPEGGPPLMTVNFMGLAGCLGPLPPPVTELILERVWRGDTGLCDFLDLFNHRLVSILARARKRYRPGLATRPPDEVPYARCAFAFLGLGTDGLEERMAVPDRALLAWAGLLVQQPRSAVSLEMLLAGHFAAPVELAPFAGRWLVLEESERTALGALSGRHQALGRGAVLGARVWDQAAAFALRLGPLSLDRFLDFLPGNGSFRALVDLVRFHAGTELDFTVHPLLAPDQVPECRLGCGPRLGWTSWLAGTPGTRPRAHRMPALRPEAP